MQKDLDHIYVLICNTEGTHQTVKLTKTTGNIAVYKVEVVGSKLRKVTFPEIMIVFLSTLI